MDGKITVTCPLLQKEIEIRREHPLQDFIFNRLSQGLLTGAQTTFELTGEKRANRYPKRRVKKKPSFCCCIRGQKSATQRSTMNNDDDDNGEWPQPADGIFDWRH